MNYVLLFESLLYGLFVKRHVCDSTFLWWNRSDFFLYLSNSSLLCLAGLDYLIYENLVAFLLFQVAALIGSILVFC